MNGFAASVNDKFGLSSEPYRKSLSEKKIGRLCEEEGGRGGVEVFSDSGLGHLETKKKRAGQAEKFLEMCQQPSAAALVGGRRGVGGRGKSS